jgi:hypothetical protein
METRERDDHSGWSKEPSRPADKIRGPEVYLGSRRIDSPKSPCTLWVGLDVHPIYWSDALALVRIRESGAAQLVAPQLMQADVVARRNLGGSVPGSLGDGC